MIAGDYMRRFNKLIKQRDIQEDSHFTLSM